MKILLLRTWLPNLGNGFIDKGAKTLLQKSYPEAEIYEVSGYPNYAADQLSLGQLAGMSDLLGEPGEKVKDHLRSKRDIRQRMVNVAEYIDADVAVLPGCTLYKPALVLYEEVLKNLNDRGIEIMFLGAGGGNYDKSTQEYVTNFLKKLDTKALLTRDHQAYNCYSDQVEYAYSGIDCAFFINDWYTPPKSNKSFATLTFDKDEEPTSLSKEYTDVVRPDHTPFGYSLPYHGHIRTIRDRYKKSSSLDKDNVFVSDTLKDYLFWYGNAQVTHSDRVHACIPTLAYGNKAQFHHKTPRDSLFDRLEIGEIKEKPVAVNPKTLKDVKEDQISATKTALSLLES